MNIYGLVKINGGKLATVLVGESTKALIDELNRVQGMEMYRLVSDNKGPKTLRDTIGHEDYWILRFEGTNWSIRLLPETDGLSILPYGGQ